MLAPATLDELELPVLVVEVLLSSLEQAAAMTTRASKLPSTNVFRVLRMAATYGAGVTPLVGRGEREVNGRRSRCAGELLQTEVGIASDERRNLGPLAVAVQHPREDVVGEVDLEDLAQAHLELHVVHGGNRLDATIEVARHPVGRADVVRGL